ncbi:MAG: cytochrome d ubiquinol oxidase subunit II [Granulosicoccus sp.]|jgi:cytochrome d ubiquinol oxidase subunit II
MINADTLPVIFIGLMGLAVLIYAVLDGYDLGVGILLPLSQDAVHEQQRDTMIASIGPFWDANETWLVLAIGLLLIAFPKAYNTVLFALYLPVTLLITGLILRGVAFDFRAKVGTLYLKNIWDNIFKAGSLLASLSQGYMLGLYIVGFEQSLESTLFAVTSACCVTAAYTYIGASWLILKTEGTLQQHAVQWTRRSGWLMAWGVILVSLVNLWISPDIFDRWLQNIYGILLLPVPLVCLTLFWINDRLLKRMSTTINNTDWIPFANITLIFVLCFVGLAFSFYPYIIPKQLTIWEAASATESLEFLFWGAIFIIPTILLYTVYSYRVFWGKTQPLDYY